jgi:4-hydroxythreonine-4-phosphate dehydrogenase
MTSASDTNENKITAPIGITMGCPASIGPEIVLKYHLSDRTGLHTPIIVIGDIGVLDKSRYELGLDVPLRSWCPGMEADLAALNVFEESALDTTRFTFGCPTPETSRAMASYVERAVTLCRNNEISALVTCAISKLSLNQAGYEFPGHTELLASRTGAKRVAMMLAGGTLRVVPATIHCPLSKVASLLNREDLTELIELVAERLQEDFGIEVPKIGVAGLNPHAGETGLFGHEEQEIIAPAVAEAQKRLRQTAEITGPYPPDTVFYKARGGRFDAVIAMYHDQGLIPFKLLHFDDGVNVTLGLPIIRTSVDHGTAYDIAGQGIAGISSLNSAVVMAQTIAAHRAGKSCIKKGSGHLLTREISGHD